MDESYTSGFDPGIRAAGYQPFRIDRKEHINGISDEILAEIRRSRFLVADYTLTNNGVYFEAGVAVGLGIPLIPTCRADYLGKLHFDIKHINTLKWETPEQLARDLARRIAAVIGDGPLPFFET
jgi:nucleoside 2-deoxyribosyltransferase